MLFLVYGPQGVVCSQSVHGSDEVRMRADEAYATGDFRGAIEGYERLVSLYPEEACLHARLAGCALSEPGRLSLVRRHLRIAIRKGCDETDLLFHQARLAQLEYDFERAGDLYAAYLAAAGKKARFKEAAIRASSMCRAVDWDPSEAVALEVRERIPADPEASFRYYDPDVPGIRLVATPGLLRSKADEKVAAGRMALHDGDTVLVYASLGKKGASGLDLYRVSIRMGEYTEPVLLEGTVNTGYDEQDAYLSKEGLLYFSSNRPGGLGGFDIYAVACGRDGVPNGIPYRLPYPINSVNDDQFFIPEEGGGAWMSSNRAAVEGRIHAYRIALGEGEMATGSVSWSRDEVASEGLRLRIFSEGAEVQAESLEGEERDHVSFKAGATVRIVLEDANGHLVAESLGEGEGAWELRNGSKGWEFESQRHMTTDWAVLSDVQLDREGLTGDSMAGEEKEAGGAWNTWLADRMNSAQPTGLIAAEERVTAAPEVVSDADGDESPLEEATVLTERSEPRSLADTVSVASKSTESSTQEVGELLAESIQSDARDRVEDKSTELDTAVEIALDREAEQPQTVAWMDRDAEVLAADMPDDEEQVEALLESRPEVVIAIWEARTRAVLEREAAFLDDPDLTKAGELYDDLDSLEAWLPRSDLMDDRLSDGLAIGDIREMLDEWSVAVQSASKASLAEVAGEAALALRRERLAIRELSAVNGVDIDSLKRRWSDWRGARRGDPEVSVAAAEMTVEGGDGLIQDWSSFLSSNEVAWSRLEKKGWRGNWIRRQMDEQKRFEEEWNIVKAELEEASADSILVEVQEDDAPSAEEQVLERSEIPVSEAEAELLVSSVTEANRFRLSVLFPDSKNEAEEKSTDLIQSQHEFGIDEEWGAAIEDSKEVGRAWNRLDRVLEGVAMPAVSDRKDWMALDPKVQKAYGSVIETTLHELEAICDEGRAMRQSSVDDALAWKGRRLPSALAEELDALILELDELNASETVWRERYSADSDSSKDGSSTFDFYQKRSRLMKQSESNWRAWAKEWNALVAELEAVDSGMEMDLASLETTEADEPEVFEEPMNPLPESQVGPEIGGVLQAQSRESVASTNGQEDGAPAGNLNPADMNTDEESDSGEMGPTIRESASAPVNLNSLLSQTIEETKEESNHRMEVFRRLEEELAAGSTGFSPATLEAASALREFKEIAGSRPTEGSSRSELQAWDKRRFFNERRLRSSMAALDLSALEAKLEASRKGSVLVGESPSADELQTVDLEIPDEGWEEPPVNENEADFDEQARMLEGYGIVLPEVEVVGSPNANSAGLTLRPIGRQTTERVVLGRSSGSGASVSAAERYASEAGAPRAQGVEYKVQIGAFRKALPAAIFAAFDPMWAQSLPSGITRYMAGSFDLYDAALEARDAIRALGYSDAFVVRFVDGEKVVGSSRPSTDELAQERARPGTMDAVQGSLNTTSSTPPVDLEDDGAVTIEAASIPNDAENIPTWDGVQGRVFSVQIGAFRGVPDAGALADLGTLTQEDTGTDGWLRLFSGRFADLDDAETHRESLRTLGWSDAFLVVYVNGRRIPMSQASTTAVSSLPRSNDPAETTESPVQESNVAPVANSNNWYVELGVFNSTIPVRLANAILAAPLQWNITSIREGGLTRYVTGNTSRAEATSWFDEARSYGFSNAQLKEKP